VLFEAQPARGTYATRAPPFCPQHWLLCHLGLYKFEFEFEFEANFTTLADDQFLNAFAWDIAALQDAGDLQTRAK
jgi:hypothetical protein